MNYKKIGIVGCGAIGTDIARAIDKKIISARLAAICDIDESKARSLIAQLKSKPKIAPLKQLVSISDIIVESAGISAVKDIADECIKKRKTLLIMSAGYLLSHPTLIDTARKKGCRIIIPSGAIAGLDAIKAAKISGIKSAMLITTKSPRSLHGAPFFEHHKVNLRSITSKCVIFEGSALDAIKWFPANINVSAILAMAGIGPEKTTVQIIADPAVHTNIHEITVVSKAGTITTRTENIPSPANPKTSYLAILSSISALKDACA